MMIRMSFTKKNLVDALYEASSLGGDCPPLRKKDCKEIVSIIWRLGYNDIF